MWDNVNIWFSIHNDYDDQKKKKENDGKMDDIFRDIINWHSMDRSTTRVKAC